MCTTKCCAVCGLLLDKPYIKGTWVTIVWFASIASIYSLIFGIGVGWSDAWSLINDNDGLYCLNWKPFWYCFWYGIWFLIMFIPALAIIGGILLLIGYFIYKIGSEVIEVTEQTKLIKGDGANLITNMSV